MSDIFKFISGAVALDLEIHPETGMLLKIGAVNPTSEKTLSFQGQFDHTRALRELDAFCRGATCLIGHNISRHDLPYLKAHYPQLSLCSLPLIDTLFLSPLAFPKNPYHRLVKDYKIVKETVNDPVADARCTVSLLQDQWAAFTAMPPALLGFYGHLLARSFPHDHYVPLFQSLSQAPLPDMLQTRAIWEQLVAGRVCQQQAVAVFEQMFAQPADAACLAYMLAWIQVAGENSVLPPWVRHQFPHIPGLLDILRGQPCLQPDCAYCQRYHDPVRHLQQWFGKPMFRAVKDELPPIQQQIVETLIRGQHCLAILPTGFGKSVCYQLPALMKATQRNQLSLILSPLQSLMKDQVDGLKRNGILNVGTINGLLTMLERSQTLEAIRLGDIDLLWMAPEQLRNSTVKSVLRQREIGLVVIDEAHCFSKWGHDFRPDYLHIARFLKEECLPEQSRLPQIACFTATAKKDVIAEIRAYFQAELTLDLHLFYGGHERPNLHYIAENVHEHEKDEILHERLTQIFQETHGAGGGIVFASTRSRVEKLCKSLADRGWRVDHFHGGRTPDDKKQVQDQFLHGELQVIVATNAFGMGIDKPDVRVVLHADAPGSLENYLQEAGRAGRDGEDAWCFLLFNEEDLETQFKLSAHSRIEWRDLSGMLTGLKKLAAKDKDQTIVLTSGEILRNEQVEEELTDLSVDEQMYDTKVKTAIAWLERNGKLVRGDNRTHMIQGQILADNLQKAKEIVDQLGLSHAEKTQWLTLLQALFQCDPKELVNTDRLSLATGLEPKKLLSIMHSMREAGLINHDLNMTAYVHRGVADDSRKRFQKHCDLELALLKIMQELEPDMTTGMPCDMRLKEISQTLKDQGETDAIPARINEILALMFDEQLLRKSIPMNKHEEIYRLYFRKEWSDIRTFLQTRNAVCTVILDDLLARLPATVRGKDLLVAFRSSELHTALKNNMTTAYLSDLDERSMQCLGILDIIKVIKVQGGLTVFRPAMTITVTAAKDERFTKKEYEPLSDFYQEKILQVHIIGRYAEMAIQAIEQAIEFVAQYFRLDRLAFLRIYFKDQAEQLELPTTSKMYDRIVTSLNNPIQEQVVTAPLNKNLLIVAGPGSGKTRTIVHRIAYLVRVNRVPPMQILAVAFNRSAVTQLKVRLKALIGKDAAWVRVRTYHSLAMVITGRSFAGKPTDKNDEQVFTEILHEAVQVLEHEAQADHGALGWRDTLLSGLRFILVDEYQDINAIEYRFLSLLAGRNEQETGRQPVLLAVGDDDQNIYAWNGANVQFIKQFQTDYQANLIYLTENYRSTKAIIAAANALIRKNRDRIKSTPIVCAPNGRNVELKHKVTLITTPDQIRLLKATLEQAQTLLTSPAPFAPGDICLLCRTNQEMYTLQIMARQQGIPVTVLRPRRLPLTLTREFVHLMTALNESPKELLSGESLRNHVEELSAQAGFSARNIWVDTFRAIVQSYCDETLDARLPVGNFLEYVYDVSRETKQIQRPDKNNVLLATMHTAKGMEFPVVMIAGQPLAQSSREEERRLYYVAMTRAMQRLYCFHHKEADHPFIADIMPCGSQFLETRAIQPNITPQDAQAFHTHLWELELADVILSFPGYRGVSTRAQPILSTLEPGQSEGLAIKQQGPQYLITQAQTPLGRLSAKGIATYTHLLSQGYTLDRILFLAAIKRDGTQEAEEFQRLRDIDTWFTGLYQMIFTKPA